MVSLFGSYWHSLCLLACDYIIPITAFIFRLSSLYGFDIRIDNFIFSASFCMLHLLLSMSSFSAANLLMWLSLKALGLKWKIKTRMSLCYKYLITTADAIYQIKWHDDYRGHAQIFYWTHFKPSSDSKNLHINDS